MKKILCTALSALMLAPLCAFDWGGKLNTTTKYQGKKFGSLFWYESAGAHAWLTTPIGEQLRFAADASYEFRYDQDGDIVKNIIDINLLKLTGTFHVGKTGMFEFGAGRFSLSDATGIIFSQISDGIYAKYSLPVASVSIYGSTTRLLNSHDVVILRYDGQNRRRVRRLRIRPFVHSARFFGEHPIGVFKSGYHDRRVDMYRFLRRRLSSALRYADAFRPDFEQSVLRRIDDARYGKREYDFQFDEIVAVVLSGKKSVRRIFQRIRFGQQRSARSVSRIFVADCGFGVGNGRLQHRIRQQNQSDAVRIVYVFVEGLRFIVSCPRVRVSGNGFVQRLSMAARCDVEYFPRLADFCRHVSIYRQRQRKR